MEKRLKYISYTVAFQEVPDNISLIINISGCPYKCRGCHSEYLWEYTGNFLDNDLESLIYQYKNLITCVCFMGGDQSPMNLKKCLKIAKNNHLKTCLYSGNDDISFIERNDILKFCDYIKIGHFDINCGGLDNPLTNQKFYEIKDNGREKIDITYKFLKQTNRGIKNENN